MKMLITSDPWVLQEGLYSDFVKITYKLAFHFLDVQLALGFVENQQIVYPLLRIGVFTIS